MPTSAEPEFFKFFTDIEKFGIFKLLKRKLKTIPSNFHSSTQYKKCFYPALLEETIQSIESVMLENIAQDSQHLCEVTKVRRENNFFTIYIQAEDKPTLKDFQTGMIILISNKKFCSTFQEVKSDSYCFGIITNLDLPKCQVTVAISVEHAEKSMDGHFGEILSETIPFCVWAVLSEKFSSGFYCYMALQAFEEIHEVLQKAILSPQKVFHVQNIAIKEISHYLDSCSYTQSFDLIYNEIQKKTIQWAIDRSLGTIDEDIRAEPFTIVRGPPGTGKTHTLRYYRSVTALIQEKNVGRSIYLQQGKSKHHDACRDTEKVFVKPRILVCAPSNAGVDNICEKVLKMGFKQTNNMPYRPGIIRLGAFDAFISDDIKSILIQTKVNSIISLSEIEWNKLYSQFYCNVLAINQQIENINLTGTVVHSIDMYIQSIETRDRYIAELARLELVNTKRTPGLSSGKKNESSDLYRELETSFLDEAEIIFTTLALCGRHTLKNSKSFDVLLIDEAAQANELATLIPLTLGVKHCILIGDNFQLPSTIISDRAKTAKFGRSLFQRLLENHFDFISLSIQYRMLPEIRYFPSRFFYDGILVDDLSISNKEIFNMMWPSKPYLLFDTRETVETRGTRGSVVNLFEVCLILSLIRCFTSMNPGRAHKSIAVITPYKEQKDLIEQTLIETFGESSFVPYVSTIDGFQGKECEFVIISCVRAANNIGFLSDAQRLNVAVTRAKKRCWILGNLNSLHRDKIWRHVVEDAVSRYCIIQGRESHAILRSFSDQI